MWPFRIRATIPCLRWEITPTVKSPYSPRSKALLPPAKAHIPNISYLQSHKALQPRYMAVWVVFRLLGTCGPLPTHQGHIPNTCQTPSPSSQTTYQLKHIDMLSSGSLAASSSPRMSQTLAIIVREYGVYVWWMLSERASRGEWTFSYIFMFDQCCFRDLRRHTFNNHLHSSRKVTLLNVLYTLGNLHWLPWDSQWLNVGCMCILLSTWMLATFSCNQKHSRVNLIPLLESRCAWTNNESARSTDEPQL